jgi:predicted  nucleic acid-binding Zn-ribbon protein
MNGASLLALQEIDSALDAIVNRRPRLAELAAHKAATAALAQHRALIAAAHARIDAAQIAIDAAEKSAHDLTTKRARLEAQLKTVIAPREAEALMHQIATLNDKRGDLDDQELAALDDQAEGESELAALAEDLSAHEAIAGSAAAALEEATGALDAEAASLAARRVPIVASLSADDLAAYERARRQFGGVAVAKLDGLRCTGCHLDLSRSEVDLMKNIPPEDMPECPQCGRFLVR